MRTAIRGICVRLVREILAACFPLLVEDKRSPAMSRHKRTHSSKKEVYEITSKLKEAANRRSRLLEKCQRSIVCGCYLTAAGGAVTVLAIVSPLPTLWHAIAGLMLIAAARVFTARGKSKEVTVKEQIKEDNARLDELTEKGREMSWRLYEAAEILTKLNRIQRKKLISTCAAVVGGVVTVISDGRAHWTHKLAGLASAVLTRAEDGRTVKRCVSSEKMSLPECDIAGLQKDWDAFVKEVVWESQNLSDIPEMYTSELRGHSHHFFQELKALLRRTGYLVTEETAGMEETFFMNLATLSLNIDQVVELIASLIDGKLSEASEGLRDLAEGADSIVNELIRLKDFFDLCLKKYHNSCTSPVTLDLYHLNVSFVKNALKQCVMCFYKVYINILFIFFLFRLRRAWVFK